MSTFFQNVLPIEGEEPDCGAASNPNFTAAVNRVASGTNLVGHSEKIPDISLLPPAQSIGG
jgi:hypothetical protein